MDGSVGWLEGWLIEIKNIVWFLVELVQHSNDSYLRHLPVFCFVDEEGDSQLKVGFGQGNGLLVDQPWHQLQQSRWSNV